MAKYRKKPALTDATQWFKNGDHPLDNSTPIKKSRGSAALSEGEVVKHFRSLNIPGGRFCPLCGNVMHKHGLLDGENAVNSEEIVCPGDYVVTHPNGKFYRLHSEEFEAMFEPYDITPHPHPMPTTSDPYQEQS
jgi:hypothetical protein